MEGARGDARSVMQAHKYSPKWTPARARDGPTEVTYRIMFPNYGHSEPMPSFKPPHTRHTSGLHAKVPPSDYQHNFHVHPLAVREAVKWDKNASNLFGQNPIAFGYDNSTYGRGYVKHVLKPNEPCIPFNAERAMIRV